MLDTVRFRRYALAALSFAAAGLLCSMPVRPAFNDKDSPDSGPTDLPTVDYLAEAKDEWDEKNRLTAFALLDVHEDANPTDKAWTDGQRKRWEDEVAAENTPFSILWRCGAAAVVGGKPDGAVEVGCTLAADLTAWGDIRDLIVEGVHAATGQEVDSLVAALSGLGIVTSVITINTAGTAAPFDIGLSLLKNLAKLRALTGKFMHPATKIAKVKLGAGIKKLLTGVHILYEKAGKSFPKLAAIMRRVPDAKTLERIGEFSAEQLNCLHGVLVVAGRHSKDLAESALAFAAKKGPNGLDALRLATRKGAAGIQKLIKYGPITSRLVKGVYKAYDPVKRLIEDQWTARLVKWGRWWEALRISLVVLFFALGAWGLKLHEQLADLVRKRTKRNLPAPLALAALAGTGAVVAVGIVMLGYARRDAINDEILLSVLGKAKSSTESEGFTVRDIVLSAIAIAIIVGSQFMGYLKSRRQLTEVAETLKARGPVEAERHLQATDVYYDLPLIIGLAGTVLGLILTQAAGVQIGKFYAFGSTLLGILVYLELQVRHVVETRHEVRARASSAEPNT